MTTARVEMLQRMPIFGAIRDDTVEMLLRLTREVAVAADEWFFREGESASGLFVLEQGSASVLKGWDGRQYLLRRLHPGDCFGEMALMDLQPRSASVRADIDCRAIALDSEALYRLAQHDLEQFALIQMNLGREVSRRLRDTDELLFRVRMGHTLDVPPPWPGRA